jgi:hypothetical protein
MRKLAVFALVSLAGCAAPLPQQPPAGLPLQIPAPEVRLGDTWTYRVYDGYTHLPRGEQTYRVSRLGERIEVTVTLGEGVQEERLFDRNWSWLKHPATNLQAFEYRPAYPAFDFPLAAGKRWQARLLATDPADGRRFPLTLYGEVLGWERIKVPAGEFDTLKVRRQVFFDYWVLGVRGRSEIVEVEWYAPAVKQAVRREASSQYWSYLYSGLGLFGWVRIGREDNGGPRFIRDDWLVYELTAYSLR